MSRRAEWKGDPDNPLPNKHEAKRRTFSWWWPLIGRGEDSMRKYVLELTSRENFLKFYQHSSLNEEVPGGFLVNQNQRGPGGDGGKVFIFAKEIKGDGKILADGGDGSIGGKGGEVRIVSEKNEYTGEISAKGGKPDSQPVFNVQNSQLHFGYGDNIKNDKVVSSNKKELKDIPLWLKYIVAIVAVLGLGLGILGFIYKQQLGDVYRVVSKNQNGGITAGSVSVNNNYQVVAAPTSTKINSLPFSVFDLAKQVNDFSGTSVDQEDYFKKYIGLSTLGSGYVVNVFSFGSDFTVGNETSVTFKKELRGSELVRCVFGSDWEKTVKALKINQKVEFYGAVNRNFLGLELRGCKIR